MVAPAIALLNPYVLGAAAVGFGAVALGLVKREDADRLAEAALHESTALTLKMAPWLIATMTGARPQPLWRPDALPMATESAPVASDVVPTPTEAPPAPVAPKPPKDPLWHRMREAIDTVQSFIRSRWYIRWAPVPLGIAGAFAYVVWVDHRRAGERKAMSQAVPAAIRSQVLTTYPAIAEGMAIVQRYADDDALMSALIPKLFSPVYTPDGALLVMHCLLETLSLHPAVNSVQKRAYVELVQMEFRQVVGRFANKMQVMESTKVLSHPESLFSAGDMMIQGHIVKPGMQDIIDEMRGEKDALKAMLRGHLTWLKTRHLSAHVMREADARLQVLDERMPLNWGSIQAKLGNPKVYMDSVQQSFEIMQSDFVMKNLDVREAFESSTNSPDAANSTGSMLGIFASILFLQPSWTLVFRSIPFMFAGSLIHGAHTAVEQSAIRHPIKFCLPGYGTLCDTL